MIKKRVYNMDSTSTDYTRSGVEELREKIRKLVVKHTGMMCVTTLLDEVEECFSQAVAEAVDHVTVEIEDQYAVRFEQAVSQAVAQARKEEREKIIAQIETEMQPAFNDFTETGQTLINEGFRASGREMIENIGYMKGILYRISSLSVQDTGEEKIK